MKNLSTQKLKKIVKEKYSNAINIELGSNGVTNGIWFYKDENAKLRTFISS